MLLKTCFTALVMSLTPTAASAAVTITFDGYASGVDGAGVAWEKGTVWTEALASVTFVVDEGKVLVPGASTSTSVFEAAYPAVRTFVTIAGEKREIATRAYRFLTGNHADWNQDVTWISTLDNGPAQDYRHIELIAQTPFNASLVPKSFRDYGTYAIPSSGLLFAGDFNGTGVGVAFRFTSLTLGSAVPESKTWAMMVLGFGAIGYAMRRKTALRFV
jgi:hypothetical protein